MIDEELIETRLKGVLVTARTGKNGRVYHLADL